jgi:hypothetical protein
MKNYPRQNRRGFIQKTLLLSSGSLIAFPTLSKAMSSKRATKLKNIRYVTVAASKGRFFGWPANNGMWKWDNGREILVGFTNGPFEDQDGHNIGKPQLTNLARSMDGGKTWKRTDPDNFVGDGGNPKTSPGNVQFGHPDFALRVAAKGYHGTNDDKGRFFYSYDRGKKWSGPYRFNGLNDDKNLQGVEITSRTNYMVTGANSIQIYMTARKKDIKYASRLDKPFIAESTDGGKTFHFVCWAVPWTDQHRAVMPSVVRSAAGNLLMAARRRNPRNDDQSCWIDAFESRDNGHSWSFLSKVGDTGLHNGNPPGLTALKDGRLACCYANRSLSQLLIRFSEDGGSSWGDEIVIRDNPYSYDMGYPQLLQNDAGEMVALYYIATEERQHSYIEAAIWTA